MITRAMRDFGVAPEQTFLIGDADEDMQAGADAGCQTIRAGEGGFGSATAQILSQLDGASKHP
jgi:histidinol phosphatase-like enzyme